MLEDLKAIKTDKRSLRRFGISFSIVLIVWGSAAFLHKKDIYFIFFGLSPLFLLSAFFLPFILKPFHILLSALFIIVSNIITCILLCLVFYFVITPMSLLARLFGRDILRQRMVPEAPSYWVKRKDDFDQKMRCERQF